MTSGDREGLIGKAPAPHTGGDASESDYFPDEENIDQGTLEEDLKDPAEKRNATDGYAPADEGVEPKTVDEDLEQFED
jgi:hypothetical protein